jgi:hypothetical protein
VLRSFDNYLHLLRRELSVEDPWDTAKHYADKLNAVPRIGTDNPPLSGKEKDDIQKKLDEIKRLLLDHAKNDERKEQYVQDQFRVLNNAITTFGKKDYLMLVYSVVIGVAITIGVPPGLGTQIVQMLHGLLSLLPQLIA